MNTPYTILPNDQVPPILAKYVWEDAETKIIGVFEWKGRADAYLTDPQFTEWRKEQELKWGKAVAVTGCDRWLVAFVDLRETADKASKEIDTVA